MGRRAIDRREREQRAEPPGSGRRLYYLEDLAVLSLTEILGCSEGALKAHLCKGCRSLARRLGAEIGEDR